MGKLEHSRIIRVRVRTLKRVLQWNNLGLDSHSRTPSKPYIPTTEKGPEGKGSCC